MNDGRGKAYKRTINLPQKVLVGASSQFFAFEVFGRYNVDQLGREKAQRAILRAQGIFVSIRLVTVW